MSDAVERLKAALSGRYRIERELGAGGMATVYLAEDLKHQREVAIKVLKPELAAVLGAERFVQEITTTAQLQHPHILPLFDSGTADGFLFYVMPYIEGETLRDRLDRETQLSIDEAVRITTEVADALDYAHRHGVIHRDIKPENILLHDGRPMVADFGIALAVSAAAGGRMTETGLSLGTPHYMSPEQATADKDITGRSDIYSLGSVLYEMLTGDPPHTGSSAQQIIMKIVTEEAAPVTKLRKSVPPNVAAAVAKALEKLPADRFDSAKAFAEALANPAFSVATVGAPGVPLPAEARGLSGWIRSPWSWGALAALVLLAVAAWALGRRPVASRPSPVSFVVTAKGAPQPTYTLVSWPAAVSPDGRQVVYAGATGPESYQYYVRDIGKLDARPLPGTQGAAQPVFSPDGRWLAFVSANGKLEKVPVAGGAPIAVTDWNAIDGAAWAPSGEIVLGGGAPEPHLGLVRLSENGGTPVPLTTPDSANGGGIWHVWPVLMPDGRTIVFSIWSSLQRTAGGSELAMTSLDDGVVHPLGIHGARALGYSAGDLIYLTANGNVMATRFDLRHRRAIGSPVVLVDSILMCPWCNGDGAASLSPGGGLAYVRGVPRSRLVWMSADGTARDAMPDTTVMQTPRLSPDGGRISLVIIAHGRPDIWIYQISNHTRSPLTTSGSDYSPEWTRDGRYVEYVSRGGDAGVWRQAADFSGHPERMLASGTGTLIMASVPSPDLHRLLVQALTPATPGIGLFAPAVGGAPIDSPYVAGSFTAPQARFSPDGHRVAYASDESGRSEVYVQSFPTPGARLQISTRGGSQPVWGPEGRTLYYVAGQTLMEARLSASSDPTVVSRDSLFSGPYFGAGLTGANYDVSRDGKRFLIVKPTDEQFQLVVTLNWTSGLKARVGGN